MASCRQTATPATRKYRARHMPSTWHMQGDTSSRPFRQICGKKAFSAASAKKLFSVKQISPFSSSKQQQLQGASEDVDPRSNGGKQRELAQCKAPEVVLTRLREAREAGVPAQHVLLTRGSAHRHRSTRSTSSATTSSRVSKKAGRCTSASKATCRTSWPSTGARRSAAYLLSVEAEAVKDGKR